MIAEVLNRRDAFAATAPEPDAMDLCDLMGLPRDTPMGDEEEDNEFSSDDDDDRVTVIRRWRSLPMKRRLELTTQFSYLWADAMIAASGTA